MYRKVGLTMSKDTLVLKDETIIELEAGASLGALQVLSAGKAAMLATWEQLTADNLSSVQVKNGDGLVVGNYTGLVLVSEMSTVASDGSVLTTYSLREKSPEEKRLDALEAGQRMLVDGQSVQDGAIEDMGAVVSTIAGQVEGGQA